MAEKKEFVSEKPGPLSHNPLDYTALAEQTIQNLIRHENFHYDDAALIFEYLQKIDIL